MKKIYWGAFFLLPLIGFSWFGVQKIEADMPQSNLVYNQVTESYYLSGDKRYANQSLKDKFQTMKSIIANEERYSQKK